MRVRCWIEASPITAGCELPTQWHQQQQRLARGAMGDRIATGNLNPSCSIKHRMWTLSVLKSFPICMQKQSLLRLSKRQRSQQNQQVSQKTDNSKRKREEFCSFQWIRVNYSSMFFVKLLWLSVTFLRQLHSTTSLWYWKLNASLHNTVKGNGPGPVWEVDLNTTQVCVPEDSRPKMWSIDTQPLHFKSNLPVGV